MVRCAARYRIFVTPAALLAIAACVASPVAAHAVLLRSTPPGGETLVQAPSEVQLLFSEPLNPSFSGVTVVNETGQVADLGDGHVLPANENEMAVSLRPGLPRGVYTVRWRTFSTIDMHPDGDDYNLYVGVAPPGVGATAALGVAGVYAPPFETTLARWWLYLAVSLLAGSLITWKLVFSPSLAAAPSVSSIVQNRLRRTAQAAALLLIAGTLFGAVAQASAAAGVPLWAAVGTPLRELLRAGRFALIWWPRLGAEFVVAGFLSGGRVEAVRSDLALSMVPAILLASSLATHGAALPIGVVPGVALDWLHLLAATVWVGGLASLLIVIPELVRHQGELLQPILRQIIRRFSRLAVVAVAMLGLSGVVQAVLEVGSWEALFQTAYGLTVVGKALLMAFMVTLGASSLLNAPLSSRSVGTSGAQTAYLTRRLVSHVRAELVIGVLLLGLAAILTGLIPAWLARTPAG